MKKIAIIDFILLVGVSRGHLHNVENSHDTG